MTTAEEAYNYARNVIEGRWAEGEPIIMKEAESAYCYARDIIKGKWAEAEPAIAKRLGGHMNMPKILLKAGGLKLSQQ